MNGLVGSVRVQYTLHDIDDSDRTEMAGALLADALYPNVARAFRRVVMQARGAEAPGLYQMIFTVGQDDLEMLSQIIESGGAGGELAYPGIGRVSINVAFGDDDGTWLDAGMNEDTPRLAQVTLRVSRSDFDGPLTEVDLERVAAVLTPMLGGEDPDIIQDPEDGSWMVEYVSPDGEETLVPITGAVFVPGVGSVDTVALVPVEEELA